MDWVYSDKVKEHFQHPKNILDDENNFAEDGKGYVGNAKCGDMMMMVIKVDKKNNTISDCKWKTYGCASAIASTSMLSEMVIGMTLEDAYKLKPQDIMKQLDGLPNHKIHCSVLGDQALRAAIDDYYKRSGNNPVPVTKEAKIVCSCMNISDENIKEQAFAGVNTFEELQEKTGISTVCGNCEKEAKTLFEEFHLLYEEEHGRKKN